MAAELEELEASITSVEDVFRNEMTQAIYAVAEAELSERVVGTLQEGVCRAASPEHANGSTQPELSVVRCTCHSQLHLPLAAVAVGAACTVTL